MKPSELFQRTINGENVSKLAWQQLKDEFFGFEKSFKAFIDKSYEIMQMIIFAVIKFLLLKHIFINKIYPSQGFEKTVIFLILVIIVFLKTSKKAET